MERAAGGDTIQSSGQRIEPLAQFASRVLFSGASQGDHRPRGSGTGESTAKGIDMRGEHEPTGLYCRSQDDLVADCEAGWLASAGVNGGHLKRVAVHTTGNWVIFHCTNPNPNSATGWALRVPLTFERFCPSIKVVEASHWSSIPSALFDANNVSPGKLTHEI
jgi:hypothetical protein